jgi:hypothetical protein
MKKPELSQLNLNFIIAVMAVIADVVLIINVIHHW